MKNRCSLISLLKMVTLLSGIVLLESCETFKSFSQIVDQKQLDNDVIVAGLCEALTIGVEKSTAELSSKNGFSKGSPARILLPSELQNLANQMNAIGLGSLVQLCEDKINETASLAVIEAKPVLLQALSKMTLTDAKNILFSKNQHAATDYFKKVSQDELVQKFQPIVRTQMEKVGLSSSYRNLLSQYQAIPFAKKPNLDIENYIVNSIMNSTFTHLEKVETEIRSDPVARTSELLKQVFGQ